ncbi:hypothetical protein C8Q74DRAFT_1317874 [Fomes fomentarius]|nr:hypothetical protein C8Q74DRAFT_1317874 [Fomes fomentarius]
MYLPSRPTSLLHQKMFPDPDEEPSRYYMIPDLLTPIFPNTWPNLRSSPPIPAPARPVLLPPRRRTAHTVGMPDAADQGSMQTNRATTSHRSMSRSSTGGAIQAEARDSLPSLQRSPTPPGLPSKRGSHLFAQRRASLPITPCPPPTPAQTRRAAPRQPTHACQPRPDPSHARSVPHKPPRSMEPVPEDTDADAGEYSETRSLQLPSPPASPDEDMRWRAGPGSSSSPSSRRPSLSGRQSTPNALPSNFRPRSSTGPSALPLTAAFQTSVLRSGTGGGASSMQRYPSITRSPPPPSSHRDRERARSRPSSVSVSMSMRPSPSPSRADADDNIMGRPTEAFRRLSTTDIRHRHPHSSREEDPSARGFLRTSDAVRVPHVQQLGPGPSSHRHATVYNAPPPPPPGAHAARGPSGYSSPPPPLTSSHLSPPALSPLPSPPSQAPRLTVHTNASASTSMTSPHHRALGMGGAHPSGVTWKSLASGSRASLASQQSRSRSNSVRSVRTLPGQLPPIDPLTPITLSPRRSFEDEDEDEDEEGQGRRT